MKAAPIHYSVPISTVRASFQYFLTSLIQTLDILHVLSDLETYAQTAEDGETALASLREIRVNLEKLVQKMDALESGFDRIAERSRVLPQQMSCAEQLS